MEPQAQAPSGYKGGMNTRNSPPVEGCREAAGWFSGSAKYSTRNSPPMEGCREAVGWLWEAEVVGSRGKQRDGRLL